MDRSPLVFALVLAAALAHPALAQDRLRDEKTLNVPAHLQPAAGMCRVWLKDVPAAQQPAPTVCAAAIRNRPPDAVVLFGKDVPSRDTRGMAATWSSRSNFAPPAKGASLQVSPPPRLGGPEPTMAPPLTPAKVVAPKPEKPR